MDLAYSLAGNAVSRQFSDLSALTVDATIDSLIDSMACALAGAHSHGLPEARAALGRWGDTGCRVWSGFGRAPAPFAAFLNAVAMHALDYDDTDDKVPLHANGMVLPGLLADVEETRPDCDGREFLTALGSASTARCVSAAPVGPRARAVGTTASSAAASAASWHWRGCASGTPT